tara:strand:- start:511 stop:1263 length:753 start_codon:yes stop_codon:yes gene_type:complete
MSLYNLPIKTYVVHAKSGYEYHGERVVKLFKEENIPFEFVTDGTPESLTPEIKAKYFRDVFAEKTRAGSLSCSLNHIYAMERFLESNEKYGLFFEDDPCFLGSFEEGMKRLFPHIEKLNSSFIISLENTSLTFPSYWQAKKGKFLYEAKRGRMAGCYLMDRSGVEKTMEFVYKHKCGHLPDWLHNELIEKGILKMYWAQPPLIEQGSHNGILSSSISTKAKSKTRMLKWAVRKFVKMNISRLFNQKRIIE